jgi:hypothetical protein
MTCKHEHDCKEYTPKAKKAKEPVVKVEAWGYGSTVYNMKTEAESCGGHVWHSWYTFTGQPDWPRIIRETFGEGAEVVRVTPVKGEMKDHMGFYEGVELLSIYKIVGTIRYSGSAVEPYYYSWTDISDAEIESAIREHHKADAPKSKHQPDEPDEPEPKYAVGDSVWINDRGGIVCTVVDSENKRVKLDKFHSWISTDHIRLAVPSDFDMQVRNMTVRAYEFKSTDDRVYHIWSDRTAHILSKDVAAALGYPVCPLSVSGGKFEEPK